MNLFPHSLRHFTHVEARDSSMFPQYLLASRGSARSIRLMGLSGDARPGCEFPYPLTMSALRWDAS